MGGEDEGASEKQRFIAAQEAAGATAEEASCRYDYLTRSDIFPPSPKVRKTYIKNALNERPLLEGIDKRSGELLGNFLSGCRRAK